MIISVTPYTNISIEQYVLLSIVIATPSAISVLHIHGNTKNTTHRYDRLQTAKHTCHQ